MRTRSAKPAPSSSTQSNSTAPTSSCRLPPELFGHIQRLAEEDSTPSEIKHLRATFELVNKEWYNIVDHFTHLILIEEADVARLRTKLRSWKVRSVLGSRTKSISIELNGIRPVEAVKKLCELIKRAKQVSSVTVEDVAGLNFVGGERASGPILVEALSACARMRHFTLRARGGSTAAFARVKLASIRKLAAGWPKLESFTLLGTWLVGKPVARPNPVFECCPTLDTLRLIHTVDSALLPSLLFALPHSLHHLDLAIVDALVGPARARTDLRPLCAVAPCLVELNLRIIKFDTWASFTVGALDEVVGQMRAVERLSIPPHVLSRLGASLAPLPRLAALELSATKPYGNTFCDSNEVQTLLEASTSLQSVSVCHGVHSVWSAEVKGRLDLAAERKGIALVWE